MILLANMLAYGLGTTLDPLVAAGHVLAGVVLRRWWMVALACVTWAAVVTGVEAVLTPEALSPDLGHAIGGRAVIGVLFGSAAYGLARLVRRRRGRPRPRA